MASSESQVRSMISDLSYNQAGKAEEASHKYLPVGLRTLLKGPFLENCGERNRGQRDPTHH